MAKLSASQPTRWVKKRKRIVKSKKSNLFWSDRPQKSSKPASRKRKKPAAAVSLPKVKSSKKAVPGSFWDRPSKKTNSWNAYVKSTCAPGYKADKEAGRL